MLVLNRRKGQKIRIDRADAEMWLVVTRTELDPVGLENKGMLDLTLREVLDKNINLPVNVRLGFQTSSSSDFGIFRKELLDKEQSEIEAEAEKLLS